MKIEDIAAAMGKTSGAVKLLVHRGMVRVRRDLQVESEGGENRESSIVPIGRSGGAVFVSEGV
jgi:hypothetical protein